MNTAPRVLLAAAVWCLASAPAWPESSGSDNPQPDPVSQVRTSVGKFKAKKALQPNAPKPAAGVIDPFDPDAGVPEGRCGVERWSVKTLSDAAGVGRVDPSSPKDATVDSLIKTPAQTPFPLDEPGTHTMPPDVRYLGGPYDETIVYRLRARLTGYKFENDHDIHIVLNDLAHPKETLIVEIVDPGCHGADESKYKEQFAKVRDDFHRLFPDQPEPGQFFTLAKPVPVLVSGVRFFDHIHGQTGVAPNGVELHPVLSLEKAAP